MRFILNELYIKLGQLIAFITVASVSTGNFAMTDELCNISHVRSCKFSNKPSASILQAVFFYFSLHIFSQFLSETYRLEVVF